MYSVYSWKGTEVNNPNVVMGEIAGQKYGYYTTKDDSGNTNVQVHVYKYYLCHNKLLCKNPP